MQEFELLEKEYKEQIKSFNERMEFLKQERGKAEDCGDVKSISEIDQDIAYMEIRRMDPKYQFALELMAKRYYREAYTLFQEIPDYKDSGELIEKIENDYPQLLISEAVNEGDAESKLFFGVDPDDKERLSWEVLKIESGRMLVVLTGDRYLGPYHDKREDVTWASCFLREWLHTEFLESAFTNEQQGLILPTFLKNEAGEETVDQLFLLDFSDYRSFVQSKAQICESEWWLRPPGKYPFYASFVRAANTVMGPGGDAVDADGDPVDLEKSVNPAMWLDTNSRR